MASFAALTYEALTSFIAFEVRIRHNGYEATTRFAVNVPLHGAPADRKERILTSMVGTKAQFLRLLFMLLAGSSWDLADSIAAFSVADVAGATIRLREPGARSLPIFETLLRELDREPDKLDEIARLVREVKSSPTGEAIFPEGFAEIWQPIWEVLKSIPREH
jgi:hypothetical protein